MYQLATGPLAWVAFSVFFFGLILRIMLYLSGFKSTGTDTVFERINTGVRGIFFWMFPFVSKSFRKNPGFSISTFIFHIGLLVIPIFLVAHNILLEQKWRIQFWTLPDNIINILVIAVIISIVLAFFRRIALPEIRVVTSPFDYILLLITGSVFITGFLAYQQFLNYQFWLIAHILCGELMLVTIPFWPASKFQTPNPQS